MDIGIVGCGMVGSAALKGLTFLGHKVVGMDKFKSQYKSQLIDVITNPILFICLPTPSNKNGIDLSIIDETMKELSILKYKGIIVIKSTVIPGTANKYKKSYGFRIVSNPEFLTEAHADYDFLTTRIVIGGDKKDVDIICELYNKLQVPKVRLSSNKEAEMAKYMSNCMLASKVVLANEFYKLCETFNIDYNKVLLGVIGDTRIGNSHIYINNDHAYGGSCFPKDMKALSHYSTLIKNLDDMNEYNRIIYGKGRGGKSGRKQFKK